MMVVSPEDFRQLGQRLSSDGGDKSGSLQVLRYYLMEMDSTTELEKADVETCIQALPKLAEDPQLQTLVSACFCELLRIYPGCYDYNKQHLKDLLQLFVDSIQYFDDMSSPEFQTILRMMQAAGEFCIWKVIQGAEVAHLGDVILEDIFTSARDDHPAFMKAMWTSLMINIVRENQAILPETKDRILCNLISPKQVHKDMASAILTACQEEMKNCRLYFTYVIMRWFHLDNTARLTYLRIMVEVGRLVPAILQRIAHYLMMLLEVEFNYRHLVVNILTLVLSSCGGDLFSSNIGMDYFLELFTRTVSDNICIRRFVFEYLNKILQMNIRDPVIKVLTLQANNLIDFDSISMTLDMIVTNPCLSHLLPTYFEYAKNQNFTTTVMVCDKASRTGKPRSATKRALVLLKRFANESDCTLLVRICEVLEVHKNDSLLPQREALLNYSALVFRASQQNLVVPRVVGSIIVDVCVKAATHKSLRCLLAQEHLLLATECFLFFQTCMEGLRVSFPSMYEDFMEKYWSVSLLPTLNPPRELFTNMFGDPFEVLQLDMFAFKPEAVQCFERRKINKLVSEVMPVSSPQPKCFKRRIKATSDSGPEPMDIIPAEGAVPMETYTDVRMNGKRSRHNVRGDEVQLPVKLVRLDKAGTSLKMIGTSSKLFTFEPPKGPRSKLLLRPRFPPLALGIAETVKLRQRGARKRITRSYIGM